MRDVRLQAEFNESKTILIKIGTEVISSPDGFIAMGHIGSIVQQICRLHLAGKRIILVSSGSIAIGRNVLKRQHFLTGTMQDHISGSVAFDLQAHPKACAATGQSGIQSLYEMLFQYYDVACSQILLTDADLRIKESRGNFIHTVTSLLNIGIVPIINENDVISLRKTPLTDELGLVAWDNDSLASLIAQVIEVDVMIIMTDVPGFCKDDNLKCKELVTEYSSTECNMNDISFPPNSRVGKIGQSEKINAAIEAVESGLVKAVVVCSAFEHSNILNVLNGEEVGTLFQTNTTDTVTQKDLHLQSKL